MTGARTPSPEPHRASAFVVSAIQPGRLKRMSPSMSRACTTPPCTVPEISFDTAPGSGWIAIASSTVGCRSAAHTATPTAATPAVAETSAPITTARADPRKTNGTATTTTATPVPSNATRRALICP